jgi:hypothetical protein
LERFPHILNIISVIGNIKEVHMSAATGSVSKLKGTGYNQVTIPNKTPQQMGLFNQGAEGLSQGFPQILQQLMQMAQGGDEKSWGQLEAPAMRQFGELQGNIASRFSGAGTGARRSSGFNNAQSGAATDLAERLQSNRLGLQNQAQQSLMQMYQNLIGQDLNTTSLIPKKKKWWEELIPSLAGAAGQAAGQFGGMGLSKLAGLF